jgi:hypothetical protein
LLKKALLRDLTTADADITAGHRRSACTDLDAFSDTVKRNDKPQGPISKTESSSWVAAAARIGRAVGC